MKVEGNKVWIFPLLSYTFSLYCEIVLDETFLVAGNISPLAGAF